MNFGIEMGGGGAHRKNYCMVETIWIKLVIFFHSLCICNKFYKASLEIIETLNYICLKIRFDYTDSQN